MTLSTYFGIGIELIGALLVYAGARHQRLLSDRGPRPRLRWLGSALLVAAFPIILGGLSVSVALFVWVAVAMTFWSIAPLIVAWRAWRRKDFA